jgi:hypothetical protein
MGLREVGLVDSRGPFAWRIESGSTRSNEGSFLLASLLMTYGRGRRKKHRKGSSLAPLTFSHSRFVPFDSPRLKSQISGLQSSSPIQSQSPYPIGPLSHNTLSFLSHVIISSSLHPVIHFIPVNYPPHQKSSPPPTPPICPFIRTASPTQFSKAPLLRHSSPQASDLESTPFSTDLLICT